MLSPTAVDAAVREWLQADITSFDVGGAVVGTARSTAVFFIKSPCVVAGLPFAEAVMSFLGCTVTWCVREGEFVDASGSKRVPLGTVVGPANRLLQGERTALEVITRSSACASYARQCVTAAHATNPRWSGRVAATRKTTPGSMRLVEKYGAIVGGADPHRYNLSSMVMLKDNHIDVAGSITDAVLQTRKLCGFSTKIEVECRSEADALEAAAAGADVAMLDNFSPATTTETVRRLKKLHPRLIVEASGGINANTIGAYAIDGVDVVSVGRITHGPPAVDVSMKIKRFSKL
jgi:nicotinate-nucleotide pyrophosphorylase (carboxylating)